MLKRINETMQVRMTLDEANHINDLIERDRAKPVVLKGEERDWLHCPICDSMLGEYYNFCSKCGQRLDQENIAL